MDLPIMNRRYIDVSKLVAVLEEKVTNPRSSVPESLTLADEEAISSE
jgi:hypothetical protein